MPSEKTIALPQRLEANNILSLFALFKDHHKANSLTIDFHPLEFISPLAAVTLLAYVDERARRQLETIVYGHNCCGSSFYLHHVNFFRMMGISKANADENICPAHTVQPVPEKADQFVTVKKIAGGTDTAKASTEIAKCLFPEQENWEKPSNETSHFDFLEYSVSELINNVMQHAQSPGFVTAQFFKDSGSVEVAIADLGIGVRQSFKATNTPGYCDEMTDAEALTLACKPKVSSKIHLSSGWGEPINAGVGLTILREITRQTDGEFEFFSYSGRNSLADSITLADNLVYPGTLCLVKIPREKLRDFTEELRTAKVAAGLLTSNMGNFE